MYAYSHIVKIEPDITISLSVYAIEEASIAAERMKYCCNVTTRSAAQCRLHLVCHVVSDSHSLQHRIVPSSRLPR
ncbi:hypothetical protein PENSPDRAFT_650867 [Peniophora sp. CONT]|nr:hypothetical protein PENSPDRAFT_650867 [Peniophora sp. CONT]